MNRMENNNKILNLTIAILVVVAIFCGCNKSVKEEVATIEEPKNEASLVSSDKTFVNTLHILRNNTTRTQMIVKGDGTIVLKTFEPDIENIGIVDDINENETNYIYKSFTGEKLKVTTENIGDNVYQYSDTTQRTVFFDKDGKEVGLEINSYGANFSTKDKIFFDDETIPYGENRKKYFDVNTKQTIALDYPVIGYIRDNILLSTYPYSESDSKDLLIVCDQDLNEIKRIEGYAYDSIFKRGGLSVLEVMKRVKNNSGYYDTFYNFLDENYEPILPEDVDNVSTNSKSPIITVRKGDKQYDFDLQRKEKTSEEKPYVEETSPWTKVQNEKAKYEDNTKKIESKGDYEYVSVLLLNGNPWYIGYKAYGVGMSDDTPCDIYNDKFEKVLEIDDLTNQFELDGYIFVNHDTVYDGNMDVVIKFEEKCFVESHDKFGKMYFINSSDPHYNKREKFSIFDDKFNVVFDDVRSVDFYTYDDYLVMADSDGTKFYDKDLNLFKEFSRKMDVINWYSSENGYRIFIDLDTNRKGILDNEYNIIVDKLKDIEMLNDNYFTYQNGFSYGFMDYKGIPILSYSIFDTMREDAVEKDFDGRYIE